MRKLELKYNLPGIPAERNMVFEESVQEMVVNKLVLLASQAFILVHFPSLTPSVM